MIKGSKRPVKRTRAIVFVDGSNMFFLQKKLGWLVDWRKVVAYLRQCYDIEYSSYYEAHKDEGQRDKRSFFSILKELKFFVVTKRLKYILDPDTGVKTPKANFDVEITRDILTYSFYNRFDFDVYVLFSGDSDFASLIPLLKDDFGKKVIVFSCRKSLSWELRLVADDIVYLEDIKKKIFRKEWGLTSEVKKSRIKPSYRRRP